MPKRRPKDLLKHGGYIVYLIFLIGLFINGVVAILHFGDGRWLLGIWALFSILILPKATLGLILIMGRESNVDLNMPLIIWKIFPGTMQRYRSESLITIPTSSSSGNEVLEGLIRETVWLGISLFPIITFLFLR